MIPRKDKANTGRPEDRNADRSWPDLEALARRVIRAANLAVLTHAELGAFTPHASSAALRVGKTNPGKKAG